MTVISVGGVMSSEASCLHVQHLYHLWGTKDLIQSSATWPSSGAGPSPSRPGTEALRRGMITRLAMGPVAHKGPGRYWAPRPCRTGDPDRPDPGGGPLHRHHRAPPPTALFPVPVPAAGAGACAGASCAGRLPRRPPRTL